MQTSRSSIDEMAMRFYKTAIKAGEAMDTADQQWIALSIMAPALHRAAALIEKEIKAMKNEMEKDNG